MEMRDLYHGTTGDNILQIIRLGVLRPNAEGKIFFSERHFEAVLMHGADIRRRATFAVKLRVTLPPTAALERKETAGVSDTLVVETTVPLHVHVLELYIREPRGSTVTTVRGVAEIQKYLSS